VTFPSRLRPTAPGLALGAFFFALAVAYWPFGPNPGSALRWALVALCVPLAVFLIDLSCAKVDRIHRIGALFLAWAVVTAWWAPMKWDALRDLLLLFFLAGVFVIGANLRSLRAAYIGLGLGLTVNSAFVIAQVFWRVDWVFEKFPPAGLFASKNWLAEAAALCVAGLVAHRLWLLAAAVSPCLIFTSARGALLGLAVAGLAWLWGRSRRAAAGTLVLLAAAIALCFAFDFPDRRFTSTISFGERLDIWRDTVNGLTFFGRGAGAFFHDYPSHAGLKDLLISRPTNAHSDWLQILYEYGAPGALLLALLIGTSLQNPLPAERAVLLVFLTEAAFGFPLHMPVTAALAALALGRLCGERVVVCERVPDRRISLWARFLAFRDARRVADPFPGRARDLPA
jgi:O-antigen ligase